MKSLIVGGTALVAVVAGASPAAATIGDPVADGTGAIVRSDEWAKGDVGFNQRSYTYGFPPIFTSAIYAMSGVDVPKQVPQAGEVFYIRAWAGLAWAFSDSDIAVIQLGLPEGVSVAPTGTAPTRCFITQADTGYVPTRDPGCAVFPTGASGASIQLGSYTVASGITGGSEQVSVFVPVIANRAVNGDKAWVSTQMLQTPSILPNPLYGDASLSVAPGTGPGGGTSAGLVAPSSQRVKWKGKGKAVVSWQPVAGATSYRARLRVGKKWTKWATLSNNGLKLTKLKKGKRYVLQVQAVGDAGRGPVATWRFKAKK